MSQVTLPIKLTSFNADAFRTMTTDNPDVDAAIKKLSKTEVDRLWEENVINVVWYKKLLGLFTYAWNKSTAAAIDKPFIATIEKFNKASDELVQAVASRSLSPDEADYLAEKRILNSPQLPFIEPEDRDDYADKLLAAESKLHAFYEVFKKRVEQLNISDNKYVTYCLGAQKIIKNLAQSKLNNCQVLYPLNFSLQIDTTLHSFKEKMVTDAAATYASLTIDKITPESFKQEVAFIKKLSAETDTVDIETYLRQAIKAKHDTSEIEKIRVEYADRSPDSIRLKIAKSDIEKRLSNEKLLLENALKALCGQVSIDPDSQLGQAYQNMQSVKTAMNLAKNVYIEQRSASGNAVNAEASIAELIDLQDPDENSTRAKLDLVKKYQAYDENKKLLEQLQSRCDEIARYQPDTKNLCGGKLYAITKDLEPEAIEEAATDKITQRMRFYNELNANVTARNIVYRSAALHEIIGL